MPSKKVKADALFVHWWRAFQKATPESYQKISLGVSRILSGPELPDKAFDTLDSLCKWYKSVLRCWLHDVYEPWSYWQGKLPSQENELALLQVQFESRNTGVRRIQQRLFRDKDNVPRELPIFSYSMLSDWCDLMFDLLNDDEQHIASERAILTFRYDKGVEYRLQEEHKENLRTKDEWVATMTHNFMKALSKGKPHEVRPDDDWILVIWANLADTSQVVREAVVSLFVDEVKQPKSPSQKILDDIVSSTWNAMRRLGPVLSPEPHVKTIKEVRKRLDSVKLWCHKHAEQTRKNHLASPAKSVSRKRSEKALGTVKRPAATYDAFLAHNSKDKNLVMDIAAALRSRGMKPWVDKEQIPPGRSFQDVIQTAITTCKCAVMVIGRTGLGQWQTAELRTLLSRCVEHNMPVIPVLLPGVKGCPPEFLFLKELRWVRFMKIINEKDALDDLEWGITGRKPIKHL